jgi:RNA polymerase sigma-70 factor (ECF subfamily)
VEGAAHEVIELTDIDVMRRVKEGDTSKMGMLFERHHGRIFAFCLRMTGSRQASEDLVQEVFLRALKYRKTFRGDSKLLPWLYSLARNVCYDHFQTDRRHRPADGEPGDRPSSEPNADQELVRREQLGLLQKALLRLPPERREVLVLSRFERRRYAEIGELLGCSEGAVKVRVFRAMQQLRDIFQTLQNGAVA